MSLLKKYNIRLYPIYKMLSWDLLFYYAIIYLFLMTKKGLSTSEALLTDACYQFSRLLFQLPCIRLVDTLKSRKSIIAGNTFVAISILLLIIANNFILIAISFAISAIGFNLKQLCESSILLDSIKQHRKKNNVFSKVDGHALSYYYLFDAISAFFTGFLYVINGYLPLILCFVFSCISIFLSFKFEDTFIDEKEKLFNNGFKQRNERKYLKELKKVFKFIIKSKRLRSLLIFSGLFSIVLQLVTSLRTIVFAEIDLPEKYFGVFLACAQIISAISIKQINFYHHKLKNKMLTYLAFFNLIPLIIVGLSIACNLPYSISMAFIIIWITLYSICKGPYYTSISRYLSSFVTPTVTTKIYSVRIIIDGIFCTMSSLFTSFLLGITSVSITIILVGTILLIIFLFILEYMKSHVGLNPEEYSRSEITYVELH